MNSTEYVVVTEGEVESYLAKGYRRSQKTAAEAVGDAWHHVPLSARVGLVALEIGSAKHVAVNLHPTRWRVGRHHVSAVVPFLEEVQVMDNEGRMSVVSTNTGAEYRETDQLFAERRQALVDAGPWIREEAERLRGLIGEIEEFLKRNEL